jgi:hypothetical protein
VQATKDVDSPIPLPLLKSPRTVRRKPGTLGLLLFGRIITAPFLAVAVVLLALGFFEPILLFVIPAQPAHILKQWQVYKDRVGVSNYVEYRLDRSGFTARDQLLPEEYRALNVGDPIKAHAIHVGPLGYAALDRPPAKYFRYRMILYFSAAFAVAIAGVMYYAIWLLPWRSRWLAKNGKATFGAVVSKGIYQGGRRYIAFRLTYQFKAMGELYARRIQINPQRYDSANIKDLVIILFDPKRPSRSIVYDYCDFVVS